MAVTFNLWQRVLAVAYAHISTIICPDTQSGHIIAFFHIPNAAMCMIPTHLLSRTINMVRVQILLLIVRLKTMRNATNTKMIRIFHIRQQYTDKQTYRTKHAHTNRIYLLR